MRYTAPILVVVVLCCLPLTTATPARASVLPAGFVESLFVGNLTRPTAMAFAPDGRLFICEQEGRLRVVKNGVLLPTPFLTLTVDGSGERGLLGVAFDPDFATNRFVYVYYTARSSPRRNRVSRFTANGDVAVAGSEVPLLQLNPLSATNHNGGALHFGPDGHLYIAVGDNNVGSNAQSLTTLLGKMLRINKDGTFPADNPFATSGVNRAIWAMGVRNPFTFAFHPVTGAMLINDVGESTWEEINDGANGANYGWPTTEGPTSDPRFRGPRFAYQHDQGALRGCAITGGTFYNPPVPAFPAEYVGRYLFADYCAGWIASLNLSTNTATVFASDTSPAVVDLRVDAAGDFYYLSRGGGSAGQGAVYRIAYGARPPGILTHPQDAVVAPGQSATFSVAANGSAPLSYQWQKNGLNIAGATSANYTTPATQLADDGTLFRVIVRNTYGEAMSNDARLTVTTNTPPTGRIDQPAAGTLYQGGSAITVLGSATDAEDGTLPPQAFSWIIDFHHDSHIHPFMSGSGSRSGSFVVPTTGETSSNVWYRIHLTVRDSGGLTHRTFRDVLPRKATVTLATSPSGLQLTLDGQPVTAPTSFQGVTGIIRTLGAAATQTINGVRYDFVSWSDGGAATHDISTPASNTTYTATYRAASCTGAPSPPTSLVATLSGSTLTLRWTAPTGSNPPTQYVIEAGMAPGATAATTVIPASSTSHTQSIPPGRYYIRVRARNDCGTSAPSNEVVVSY